MATEPKSDDYYQQALDKQGVKPAGETYQEIKDFNEIKGPKSSKEFLSYVQKSRQVADRPHKEAFHELLFGDFGDLVRCDHGANASLHLGNAALIQTAAENSKDLHRGGYYYQCYQKKRELPSCLMGSNRARYTAPLAEFFGDAGAAMKQVQALRTISQKYFEFLLRQVDSYTKVPANSSLLSMLWSFESVFWVLFSQSSGAFVDQHNFASRFFKAQRGISQGETGLLRNPLARFLPTPSWSLFCKSLDQSYELIEELIARHHEEPATDSLLAFLLAYRFEDGKELTEAEVKVLMTDVLIPAAGYTSPSAMWLIYDVAKSSAVQERLYEEAFAAAGDLRKCPYLFAVIKESMRLHPLQDAFQLVSAKEFDLGGYRVPPAVGIACVGSNTAVSERYFVDPLEFQPERWMTDESLETIHPYASTPYGIGPRSCPAMTSSDIQLAVLLQETVLQFRLDADADEVAEAQYQPLLIPTAPFDIAYDPRHILPEE